MKDGERKPPPFRAYMVPASLAAVLLLHIALVLYFEPTDIILGPDPLSHRDFHTHAEQAWRVSEALDGWGKSWAYDVQLLAGYPNGTVFDADNKAWELWTYVLWKAGLERGTAFNLFVLLAHLLLPIVVVASARLFRLRWWTCTAAVLLASLMWFFDSLVHTCWWIGMQAFAIAGYLFLLPLALMHRYVEEGGWWRAALMGALLAAGHLVHPYIFIVLALPMLAIYIRGFKRMDRIRHAGIWAAAAFTIAANAYWIIVAFQFWHYVLDSGFFGSSTLSYIVSDYLGLLRDPTITGNMENRTAFRVLVIGMAATSLVIWRNKKDSRFLPFALGLGGLAALVYLGGYFWITQQVQPYRFLQPLAFMAVIPAAWFVEEAWTSNALRRLPKLAYAAAGLVALVALPYLARDVLYFMPDLGPGTPTLEERKPVGERMGPEAATQKHGPPYRRQGQRRDQVELAAWLEENFDGSGRILVENPSLGEFLAWRTDFEILGGFHMRNMAHTAAHFFRRHPAGNVSDRTLERYLKDYAVAVVIVTSKIPAFESGATCRKGPAA
ncbi:MAG: hypothetical protein JRG91_13290 [Deltaproteobacteria bacterium]|nr:hypothetical protein [Deltaproteobacteria bacterium]